MELSSTNGMFGIEISAILQTAKMALGLLGLRPRLRYEPQKRLTFGQSFQRALAPRLFLGNGELNNTKGL